jgi:Protein of unknown function (DUF3305)
MRDPVERPSEGPVERMVSMPIGVVVERRALDNPWQDHDWAAVEIIPGAGSLGEWLELGRGDGWVRYFIGSAPLELHRKETDSYKVNLSNDPPQVFVLLRPEYDPEAEHEIKLFLVTASSHEVQDYLDAEDNTIMGVTMPDAMIAWVQAFVDKHHVDEPFYKRKRKRHNDNDTPFGQPQGGRGKGDGLG